MYGDVVRVKILFNKKDTALIQFNHAQQAHTGKWQDKRKQRVGTLLRVGGGPSYKSGGVLGSHRHNWCNIHPFFFINDFIIVIDYPVILLIVANKYSFIHSVLAFRQWELGLVWVRFFGPLFVAEIFLFLFLLSFCIIIVIIIIYIYIFIYFYFFFFGGGCSFSFQTKNVC